MRKLLYNDNKNMISRQLQQARIKKGLSQRGLAAKMQLMNISMDQQMISKIENNKRVVTDYELACFSLVLGVSMEELLKEFYDTCMD